MKLKVCGMKYQENIEQVAGLRPDYLGFIFYEKSARHFDGLVPNISDSIKKVGVFVNADLSFVIDKINKNKLQAIQLHGEETPEYCENLRKSHDKLLSASSKNKLDIIKVFSINLDNYRDEFDFDELTPYENVCDYYLFDTKGKLPGGNGFTFNWNVLNNYPSTKPFFLSGGIGLNEIENIRRFKQSKASKYCYAIDVNSKFEIKPGLKNIDLLKEFKNEL